MTKKEEPGKLSIEQIRRMINKKIGSEVAHSLKNENPSDVKDWIPTGSRWLDGIICRGKLAGIPVGKITTMSGFEGTGKSYLAAKIAANAQKKGIVVVYFDSESALDSNFLKNAGCNLNSLIYQQATSLEDVLETIEMLMTSAEERFLFILDSLANTPTKSDIAGDFNPNASIALSARIMSKGFKKLTVPLASHQSTFLILNQLKMRIATSPFEANAIKSDPYAESGGKSHLYSSSLHIVLTGRKADNAFIKDENGYVIGSEVKAKLKKSRFGTLRRECIFDIIWGNDDVAVRDEESWLTAILPSDKLQVNGSWYEIEGFKKFQPGKWMEMLEDEKFKKKVLDIFDEQVIQKFHDRTGTAESYYGTDDEENGEETIEKNDNG